jgi:two-component sensor histidine kinase
VDPISVGIDVAIPCGLIVNELVSNSLKHAFPDGREGEIDVRFHTTQNGQFALAIGDDGIGLPEGLDFRATQTLGLQLVNRLVHQLEGVIELSRSGGTRFEIRFGGLQLLEEVDRNGQATDPGR